MNKSEDRGDWLQVGDDDSREGRNSSHIICSSLLNNLILFKTVVNYVKTFYQISTKPFV